MKTSILLLATIAVLTPCLPVATNAATQVYDLKADWSDESNPNGVWSYLLNGSLPPLGTRGGDPFGTPPPIWGSLDAPWVGWSKSNGTEQFNHDWIAGDIFGHTGIIQIRWTSPTAGSIDVTGDVWPTRDIGRYNDWFVTLNGNPLASGVVGSADPYSRSSPLSFAALNLSVNSGDILEFSASASSESSDADYIAVNLTVNLSPPTAPGCPNASFAPDAIIWHQPLARNGTSEDTDPSSEKTVKYRFKRGSTIPIQVHALGCAGDVSSNPNVVGSVDVFVDSSCAGASDASTAPIDFNGAGGAGGIMDKVDGYLKYNLNTKSLPPTAQCLILRVTVTDTNTGEAVFEEVLLEAK